MIRKFIVFTFLFLFVIDSPVESASWKLIKSKHFIIHYQEDYSFADSVATLAEEYYGKINQDLGLAYSLKSNDYRFWLWEDRAKIYIYSNAGDYKKNTLVPEWSGAASNYRTREIFCYAGVEGFSETILPHEIAHLLFREFVGFNNKYVPRWLDEGAAQYVEDPNIEKNQAIKLSEIEIGNNNFIYYIPVEILTYMDVNRQDGNIANLFYTQSRSLVYFLIDEFGSERFNVFCRQLRDGKELNGALSFAYSLHSIKNMEDLTVKWKEWVLERRKG